MKTYSPPARGQMAASSAYVRAPAMESSPATTQTAITRPGEPTLQVITRDLRKTPVPITLPTTMEVAAITPRPRMSVESFCVGVDIIQRTGIDNERAGTKYHRLYFLSCINGGISVSRVADD